MRRTAYTNAASQVASTSGTTSNTVEAMAHGAIAFIEAMNFQRVDLLGSSIGSFVAQEILRRAPENNAHRMAPGNAVRGGRRVAQEFILG